VAFKKAFVAMPEHSFTNTGSFSSWADDESMKPGEK